MRVQFIKSISRAASYKGLPLTDRELNIMSAIIESHFAALRSAAWSGVSGLPPTDAIDPLSVKGIDRLMAVRDFGETEPESVEELKRFAAKHFPEVTVEFATRDMSRK